MRSTWLSGVCAAAACFSLGSASAEAAGVRVVVEDGLDARFGPAVDALRAETARITGADGVELRLAPVGRSLVVHARLADGRMAARVVDDPAVLVAVGLGLLATLPEDQEDATRRAPASPRPASAPSAAPSSSTAPPSQDDEATRTSASVLVEVGAKTALPTRATMLDVHVRPTVAVEGWVIALALRWAPVGATPEIPVDEDSYEELSVGLGLGRRFSVGRGRIDATFVPSFVHVSMESDSFVGGEVGGSRSQVRLGACGSFAYPISRSWRFVTSLDSEVSLWSLAHQVHIAPELPPMPAFTAGLRLGVAADLL